MLRYVLAAQFLKVMSSNAITRRLYRDVLGNICGARRRARAGLTDAYVERSKLELKLLKQYDCLRDDLKLLEAGTGWMHFFGLFPCLFASFRVVLSDIWDCRQFQACLTIFEQLETRLATEFALTQQELSRAKQILTRIRGAGSFHDLYRIVNAEYVVDSGGKNNVINGDGTFDVVVSFHVLEHVRHCDVQQHLQGYARILRPGGIQIHQIGIDDHLAHYDKSAHVKSYLRYSDHSWKRWFENRLQYFNRIQLSEWINRFKDTGMELLHLQYEECDIAGLSVHPSFLKLDERDLRCTIPTLVLRKKQ